MRLRAILLVCTLVGLVLTPVSAQKISGGSSGGSSSGGGGGKVKPPPDPNAPPELRVSNEIAAPGGLAQIKISLTEPKPISTGFFELSGGFEDLAGIAAYSPGNDTTGMAFPVVGHGLRIVATSTLAQFGTSLAGYPILTVTVHIPSTLPIGTVLPIHLDPASITLLDPNGVPYATTVNDGTITVGNIPEVDDVIPGSDVVPAGGTITILGRNFDKDVRVQIDGASVDRTTLVSPNRFDVLLKAPAAMYAQEIRLRTRTGQSNYFAYQRTSEVMLSANSALQALEPIFGLATSSTQAVDFPALGDGDVPVLLVQNSHLTPMTLTLSRTGGPASEQVQLVLPAASRFGLDPLEIFGSRCPDACTIVVQASSDVQVMGAITDGHLTRLRLLAAR